MIPLLAWWRFRDVPLDRDYTPYAYPAVNDTPWLEQGHFDIKPPLIHWSYKLWSKITFLTPRSLTESARLRLLPLLGLSLASALLATQSVPAGLTLALLCASPTLWVHMANTEWLTVCLWTLAAVSGGWGGPWPWLFLGLTPWANQKNVLLLVPVAWALGLKTAPTDLAALCLPSIAILAYLALSGRLTKAYQACWAIPKEFGKARTIGRNILSAWHLLRAGLIQMLPFIAVVNWHSPWAWVLAAVFAVQLASKQMVPHHFIAWTLPLALACEPGPSAYVAYGIVWACRDMVCWLRPELVYGVTFAGVGGGHYGQMLKDADSVEEYLRTNTKPDEHIWVNGMENQIYLNAGRKAWRIEVPELQGIPEGTAPRVIVHVAGQAKKFDYKGYEPVHISRSGALTIMERK